jgi:colanic acid biosynthesis glycosyl transferase WcaI
MVKTAQELPCRDGLACTKVQSWSLVLVNLSDRVSAPESESARNPSGLPLASPPNVSGSLDILVLGMNYSPELTGIAPYTTGMVRALAAAGHQVRVITGYPHYPGWRVARGYHGLRTSESDHGVSVTRVRHPVPSKPTVVKRILMDFGFSLHASAVLGPRPDIVIAVSPTLLTVAAGLRWKSRGRTAVGVVTQDLYGRALLETGMTSVRSANAAAQMERALLNRADGIVVVHANFVRSLAELGVDRPPISVIRNWSHVAPRRTDRAETRSRLGWAQDEIIALHAGNMGVKQGLENVVHAARRAQEKQDPVRFVLLGDGARRRHLEVAAAGLHNITFLDPVPGGEFEDALAAADVLVLNEAPTVAEMCAPSKLTSYFAAARPVVAATDPRSVASREIQRSGGGVRVDPGDPAALHDAVVALGHDAVLGHKLGARGRLYADQYLTAAGAAGAYCEWVNTLAGAR